MSSFQSDYSSGIGPAIGNIAIGGLRSAAADSAAASGASGSAAAFWVGAGLMVGAELGQRVAAIVAQRAARDAAGR